MYLSVIIPAYNCAEFLGQAVESALAVLPADSEIAIVDDGSQDGTRALAETLAVGSPRRIRVLQHPAGGNHGPGAARNLGLAHTTGDLVAFLDGDDYYLPNRFGADLPALQSAPALDGVLGVTQTRYQDESDRQRLQSGDTIGLPEGTPPDEFLKNLVNGHFWHANAFTVRRALLTRAGGFAEHLHMAEDCHLWLRLAALGRLAQVPSREPVAVYRRRRGTTHAPSLESKGCLLQALAEVSRWARGRRLAPATCEALAQGTRDYLVRSMAFALGEGRPDMARAYVQRAARAAGLRLLADRRVLRLVLAAWRRRGDRTLPRDAGPQG